MPITINGSTGISGVDGSAATPALQGGDTNTGIVFGTDTVGVSTGGVQRTTVDSSGRLLVGVGSATANGGVLELSGGITFPATAVAASNANTLDDYEEGTWTPTIIGTSSAGTGTYSGQFGSYTKIGRRVFFDVSVDWSAHTGTGSINVAGLPFASGSYSVLPMLTIGAGSITTAASTILAAYVNSSASSISLFTFPIGGGTPSGVAMDVSGTLYISGSYQI